MVQIRLYRPDDLDGDVKNCAILGMLSYNNSPMREKLPELCVAKTQQVFHTQVTIGWCLEWDKQLVGTLLCKSVVPFFSYDTVLAEMFTYILPEFRSFRAANLLYSAAKTHVRENSETYKALWAGSSLGYRNEAMVVLFERLGFIINGMTAVYVP